MRPRFLWRLRSATLELGPRTLLMGVLNVTPDSFSDGGRYLSRDAAVEHGLRMLAEGADIVDIGGESTRPGATVGRGANASTAAGTTTGLASEPVSPEEELSRVLPVIRELKRAAPKAIISIDTYKASVARAAVEAGAEIVNDVGALRWDPAMSATVAELACGAVLMHARGLPHEWRTLPALGAEVVELVLRDLAHWTAEAKRAGIGRDRIVVDPGFGFGKNFGENYPLLARLEELHRLGYPVLVGASRKSFIGQTVSRTGKPVPPEERLFGTLATVTASILQGAHLVRVHDVAAARETAAVADEILNHRVIG